MKALLFARRSLAIQFAEKIVIAFFPVGRIGGTTKPTFLLQKMKKDEAAQ